MKGWISSVVATTAVLLLALAPVAHADDPDPAPASPTAACDGVSPIALPCLAAGKFADAVAAECRRAGVPDTQCTLPLAHRVTQAARDAYLRSWAHRTAAFQYRLGNRLPLRDAQWLGTHNSFNSPHDSLTLSHEDSNQQLSLTQQLDVDMRALELDLHYVPRLELLGAKAVTVCHGQPPSALDFGCTDEPLFSTVLPQIARWLNAPSHGDQVVLLYLEDEMKDPAAYASTVSTLAKVLRRPDGSSLIYHPAPDQRAANGCTPLPLDVTRAAVRASGARVVLVGSCAPGWSSDVFDWDAVHVENGSTSAYRAFPACDATYGPSTYATKLVRYFEDSTLVSNLLDPSRPPANPDALTPAKVAAMTDCGVNLFGLDQLLPEDGRIQASLWSWAKGEPRAGAGGCTLQRSDGRWVAAPCRAVHRAACLSGTTWTLTPTAVPFAAAASACAARGAVFAVPRAGDQNERMHALAADVGGAWVRHRIT
jgi:hypothetical protein